MFRTSLLTLTLSLAACGIDPAVPALQDEAPLVTETPAPPPLRGELVNAAAPVRLPLVVENVQAHSLAAADGTQVHYLIGVMGCGISVIARGAATVQGGAFAIPLPPSLEVGEASLFFTLGETCDAETNLVYSVGATLPGSVDLSTLPEPEPFGCWMFD